MQPCGQRVGLELAADRFHRVPVHLGAALEPVGVRLAGGHRTRARGLRIPRHVRPAWPGGQRVHRHRRVGQQRRHRPVQRRTAQHDHLLRVDQPQRERVQRILGGRRGRLGDRRQLGEIGVHTRAVPGDDDRVRCDVDVQRLVECDRRRVRPWPAAGTALRRVGAGFVGVWHQRLAQRDVELHRSGVHGARSRGGDQNSACRRSPLRVQRVHPLGASSARPRLMLARTCVPK